MLLWSSLLCLFLLQKPHWCARKLPVTLLGPYHAERDISPLTCLSVCLGTPWIEILVNRHFSLCSLMAPQLPPGTSSPPARSCLCAPGMVTLSLPLLPFLLGLNSLLELRDFLKVLLSYWKSPGLSIAPWPKRWQLSSKFSKIVTTSATTHRRIFFELSTHKKTKQRLIINGESSAYILGLPN